MNSMTAYEKQKSKCTSFKSTLVIPLLKKANLDKKELMFQIYNFFQKPLKMLS